MTLILKLDLDMVKMYLHTKNGSFYVKWFKSYSLNRQKHRHTDTQTHRQIGMTKKHYLPAYAGGKNRWNYNTPHPTSTMLPSSWEAKNCSIPRLLMFYVYRTSQCVPFSRHLDGATWKIIEFYVVYEQKYADISTAIWEQLHFRNTLVFKLLFESSLYVRTRKTYHHFWVTFCGQIYRFKITRDINHIRFLQSQYFLTEYFPGFREKKGVAAFD